MINDIAIVHNMEKNRFEATLDGKVIGVAKYIFQPGFVMSITNTETRSEYEGKGIAAEILKHLLDYALYHGYKISPICSYAKAYIKKHEEYWKLLDSNDSPAQ